jgi:hypothetical protein
MPDGAKARRRQMPNRAKCQTAPNAEPREMPDGAKSAKSDLRAAGRANRISAADYWPLANLLVGS